VDKLLKISAVYPPRASILYNILDTQMKPILFIDFDGTLCHDRFWRSLPAEQYEKVQTLLFKERKSYAEEWMKGKHTAEEVNQFLSEQLRIPFEEI